MDQVVSSAEAFRRLYEGEDMAWGGHSGGGSDAYWTIEYRAFLDRFLHLNNIRTIIDIGCGDWQFSRFLNLDGRRYYGFDVVPSVVERNRQRYGSETITFDLMPTDFSVLPQADLLIMKDVLQHLPDAEITRHKQDLFPHYPCCLISNSYRKVATGQNHDIPPGAFRCLDLKAEPYLFDGVYVLEFASPLHEEIRTLLYTPSR
jgi:SAM-dependent methyltransferase